MLPPQGCKPLLLRVRVDICTDDESDDVEERHPGVLGEELLRKGEADGARDPRDLHDLPEADLDGGADLVVCPCAGDEGHGGQVDGVLDGGDLGRRVLAGPPAANGVREGTYDQVAYEDL